MKKQLDFMFLMNFVLLYEFQEGKLRDQCMIGPSDIPTEDKTITVCYGKDMTNIDFVNFVCASREVARVCPNPGNNP